MQVQYIIERKEEMPFQTFKTLMENVWARYFKIRKTVDLVVNSLLRRMKI